MKRAEQAEAAATLYLNYLDKNSGAGTEKLLGLLEFRQLIANAFKSGWLLADRSKAPLPDLHVA